jgi:AcrR family transcriptional regulator
VRAEQAAATRDRILDAAYELFMAEPYDDVTLELVAERAGVSVPTVLRHVGSKDGLLQIGVKRWGAAEEGRRSAAVGDIAGITRVLATRYEALGTVTRRYVALADRNAEVAAAMEASRQGHREWLERMFAPWLPTNRPAVRARRVAQLFAATEIYSWTTWRTSLGLTAAQATQALDELLRALVEGWDDKGERA